jgi:hypothetical protein
MDAKCPCVLSLWCSLQALYLVYPIRVDSVCVLHLLWHSQVSLYTFFFVLEWFSTTEIIMSFLVICCEESI